MKVHRGTLTYILLVCVVAACTPVRIETRVQVPDVPQPLRQPCLVAPREAATLKDVAVILTDHVEALGCANGRIASIDEILTKAEAAAGEAR